MNKIRRAIVLMLVAAVFSLSAPGCKSSGRHNDDHPHKDHPKGEHPQGDHPKGDHPKH